MQKVNPDILKWARETAGLTPEEAVRKLHIKKSYGIDPLDRLEGLEQGKFTPTRTMLLRMSKKYHRPLLTFYLSERPQTGARGKDFRKIPESILVTDTALVDTVIRNIHARQSLVRQLFIEEDEAEKLPFIASYDMKDGVERIVQSIQQHLAFDLQEYRKKKRIEDAFAYLRNQAELAGIFVLLIDNLGSHHTAVNVDLFRGFALADDFAPFIAINANDSKGAWSFTLVHELAHLWLGTTGVSGNTAELKIEKFCNDVASEFLIPKQELSLIKIKRQANFTQIKDQISTFASERNVSSTMIAYKLYRAKRITHRDFKKLKHTYYEDFLNYKHKEHTKNQDKVGGPSYHLIKKFRAGNALTHFVERMLYSGNITTTKAAVILGVKAKNVQGVLEVARSNKSS